MRNCRIRNREMIVEKYVTNSKSSSSFSMCIPQTGKYVYCQSSQSQKGQKIFRGSKKRIFFDSQTPDSPSPPFENRPHTCISAGLSSPSPPNKGGMFLSSPPPPPPPPAPPPHPRRSGLRQGGGGTASNAAYKVKDLQDIYMKVVCMQRFLLNKFLL